MIPRMSAQQFESAVKEPVIAPVEEMIPPTSPELPSQEESFSMDEAMSMLAPLSRKAFQKYPSLNFIMQPDELVNECFLQFVEKGYLQRFDSSITNKAYFVWVAVQRRAIDFLRKSNRTPKTVSDDVIIDEDVLSIYDIVADDKNHDPIGNVILEEALSILSKDVVEARPDKVEIDNQIMYFCEYWVFYLYVKGYDRDQIAIPFKVTSATVGNYIKRAQEKLQAWVIE